MRRILSLFTLVFYLLLSVGITFSFHFCGDRLNDFGIFTEAHPCHIDCPAATSLKKSCCSTTSEFLGIEEAHQHNDVPESPVLNQQDQLPTFALLHPTVESTGQNIKNRNRAGPWQYFRPVPKLYLIHQSYLVYS